MGHPGGELPQGRQALGAGTPALALDQGGQGRLALAGGGELPRHQPRELRLGHQRQAGDHRELGDVEGDAHLGVGGLGEDGRAAEGEDRRGADHRLAPVRVHRAEDHREGEGPGEEVAVLAAGEGGEGEDRGGAGDGVDRDPAPVPVVAVAALAPQAEEEDARPERPHHEGPGDGVAGEECVEGVEGGDQEQAPADRPSAIAYRGGGGLRGDRAQGRAPASGRGRTRRRGRGHASGSCTRRAKGPRARIDGPRGPRRRGPKA